MSWDRKHLAKFITEPNPNLEAGTAGCATHGLGARSRKRSPQKAEYSDFVQPYHHRSSLLRVAMSVKRCHNHPHVPACTPSSPRDGGDSIASASIERSYDAYFPSRIFYPQAHRPKAHSRLSPSAAPKKRHRPVQSSPVKPSHLSIHQHHSIHPSIIIISSITRDPCRNALP